MKVVNLADPKDPRGISYKVSKFPDGQQQLTFDKPTSLYQGSFLSVQIKSRLNNWKDLELIACAVASLREMGVGDIHLYVPYILGARSDRKFEFGSNNYLKSVLSPVINGMRFSSVTCMDPHSDVLEACINNFRKEDNFPLISKALHFLDETDDSHENVVIVSPDAGALKKVYTLVDKFNLRCDVLVCGKSRSADGKLSKTIVPATKDQLEKDFIIVDDICDGGGTFLNIAKELEDKGFSGKLTLVVTHGIFSKGLTELSKYFDQIYCTNSYKDIRIDSGYFDEDVIRAEENKDLIKQLNIF